jgi:hypothetical protein
MSLELASLVNSKYNKAYFSEKIPDRKYLIFTNNNDQILIKKELLKVKNKIFEGFIVQVNESDSNERGQLVDIHIPLNQLEGFMESGTSIILTGDMFITLIQQYGLEKIKDWTNQIFFVKVSNWILSQGIYDIHRNHVIRWAYDKKNSEDPKIIANILTLFLILYGPKDLGYSQRLESLSNYEKYQLENSRISCVYNSACNLPLGWFFYRKAVTQDSAKTNVTLQHPYWNGEDFGNKRIVFRRVPGPSDEILYANIFNDLIKNNCDVIIETDKRLVDLFTRSFPSAEVVPRLDSEPHPRLLKNDINFQANYSDPFEVYRDKLKKFPDHNGYLIPNSKKVAHWKTYFNDLFDDDIRIGVSWTSASTATMESDMVTKIEQWEPVFGLSKINFINLQYGDITNILRESAPSVHVVQGIDLYNDIDELVALIAGLDLVITVDNINSHIAGALGTPLWEIIPNHWHLLLGQNYHPFYPNAHIFNMTDEYLIQISDQLLKIVNKISPLLGESKRNKFRELSKLLDPV